MATLQWTRSPDGYRGDLSCIKILGDYSVESKESTHHSREEDYILVNGERVAVLHSYYGSGGQGKMASQDIQPLEGHRLRII